MLKITKNQGSIQVTADKSGFYPFDGTITFPTNSLFTATSANTDMITFKSTSNGDVQFVGNYKDITISGRSYDTKQKFLTAFSNLANQGSVDAYTKAETDAKLNDKLTAKTNAKDALFIRSYSNDDANSSVALYHSTVKGMNDVAIGYAATPHKDGMHNLAILNEARANGMQNIAIGNNRKCNGTRNVGIGCGAFNTVDVFGADNVCIGSESQAQTPTPDNAAVNNSIAIGSSANAYDNYCTVVGSSASSVGSHSVVIGDSAHADSVGSWSVAVGSNARAYGKNSVALGYLSCATNDRPLDICCGKSANNNPLRVIQSDANGKISLLKGDGTIERMVIQDEIEALKNAGGGGGSVDAYTKAETDTKLEAKQDKLTAGSGITITKDETAGTSTIATAVSLTDNGNGAYTVGDSIGIGGNLSVRIGNNTSFLKGQNSIAIGNNAVVNNKNSIAIGDQANTNSENCIAIGNDTNTTYYTSNCVVIGNHAQAASSYCTVIGPSSRSNTSYAVAVGYNIYIDSEGRNSVAVGSDTKAYGKNSVAIGYSSEATDDTPLVINAGNKTVNGISNPLTVLQSDSTGKISVLLGDGTDERMVIQDEIAALKNAGGGGGSANPYVNVKGTNEMPTIADDVVIGIAIGERTQVTKGESIAIGNQSHANGRCCVSVGRLSTCIGDSTVAVGDNAKSMMTKAVAIGSGALAMSKNAVAIGPGAVASPDFPLVIKASDNGLGAALPMIQGDKVGKISIPLGDGTDERMVIQDEIAALKNAGGSGGSANPYVNVKGTDSATILDYVTDAVAIGNNAYVSGDKAVAVGSGAVASPDFPLVIKASDNGLGAALPMIQGDKVGKISIPLGDGTVSTMCLQDEFAALKAEITTLKAEIAALKGGA